MTREEFASKVAEYARANGYKRQPLGNWQAEDHYLAISRDARGKWLCTKHAYGSRLTLECINSRLPLHEVTRT